MLCSDDKHPDDLIEGHIDALVRRGIAKGIPVWNLLQAAVVNPVKHYNMGTGLLNVGDDATFIAVNNLKDFNVLKTVIDGVTVYDAANGGVDESALITATPSAETPNNFKASKITTSDIAVEIPSSGKARVIIAYDGQLLTGQEIVPVSDLACADIQKIVVYNRYGNGTPKVAYIKGFDLKNGAIGASIAHDSHNIVSIGTSDEDIVSAINGLIDAKGGVVVADNSGVDVLPLPIAGIMTDRPAEEISSKYRILDSKAKALGCNLRAPFITMAFMALPVIPSLKLTDMGLVEVDAFDFTNLFIE